jgi:putative spermidine/putrescine transport system ATP-binding protein
VAHLELQGLSKRYGDVVAVVACDLSVERGEFVCLLGPSGCGKTTTLQMIAGFAPPTAGRVVLEGRDITALPPNQRGLGIVFQSYALFPHMTVAQNVAFGLEMRDVGAAERQRRVEEALALVHLDAMADRHPKALSGGQRQRVALARALVIRPPVLLLDEPMGALDAKLREEMQIELCALQRRLGITTLMVTHDQSEAMTLADRIVLMNQGRIEQVASPFAMYEQPGGRFASTFLGRANVIELRRDPDRWVAAASPETAIPLPADAQAARVEAAAVDLIVRPEKLKPVTPGTPNAVPGRVALRVFLGNHWLFQVDTPLGPLHWTVANQGLPGVEEGQAIHLGWDAADGRVVPRGTLA